MSRRKIPVAHDLVALRAAGATYREIGELTGLALQTVSNRLNRDRRAHEAAAASGPKTRPKPGTVRPCLCCRKDFLSEGAHNRLCNRCRALGDGGPYDTPAIVRYR